MDEVVTQLSKKEPEPYLTSNWARSKTTDPSMESLPALSITLASKVMLLVMPRMVKSPVTLWVASPLVSVKASMLRRVEELVLCSETLKKSSLLRWPTNLSPHSPSDPCSGWFPC